MTSKQRMTDDGRPIIKSRNRCLADKANVEAYALIHGGAYAGRLLILHGRGMMVRAEIIIHKGPLAINAATMIGGDVHNPLAGDARPMSIHWSEGTASGGGYCKASAAIDEALRKVRAGNPAIAALPDLDGRGMNAVCSAFEAHGYSVHQVV